MRTLLLLCLLLAPALAAPVAMTTEVRGTVTLGARPATGLQQLEVGQTLELAPQAHVALIFFVDGHQEAVDGPARVTVGKSGLSGAKVVRGRSQSVAAALAGRDFQRYGGELTRAVEMGLEPTTPGVLPPGPVLLQWKPELPGPYTVRVGGPLTPELPWARTSAAAPLWEATTAANSIAYSGPALQPDKTYWWEVEVPSSMSSVRRGLRLETPAAAQRRSQELQALPGQSYTDHVLRMLVWARDYRLLEALGEARKALASNPADPGLDRFVELLKADLGAEP